MNQHLNTLLSIRAGQEYTGYVARHYNTTGTTTGCMTLEQFTKLFVEKRGKL